MKNFLLIYLTLSVISLVSCTAAKTTTMQTSANQQQPIKVISVSSPYKPGDTINPAGPKIKIILEDVSNEPIISLNTLLNEKDQLNSPWTFDFNVTSSNPLLPGQSTSLTQVIVDGGFGSGISYSLTINGTMQNGQHFLMHGNHRDNNRLGWI